jgi:hypothetical protein
MPSFSRLCRSPRAVTVGVAAALCTAVLGACSSADTAGPESGVTIDDIQEPQNFYEGEYLGKQVTVSAEVTDVLDPTGFEIAGREYGEDSLLVQTAAPTEVRQGEVVRVVGTVGQYHRFAEEEGVPPVQYDMYEEYETEAYLYDATVEIIGA